jgi:hypothetical protein
MFLLAGGAFPFRPLAHLNISSFCRLTFSSLRFFWLAMVVLVRTVKQPHFF